MNVPPLPPPPPPVAITTPIVRLSSVGMSKIDHVKRLQQLEAAVADEQNNSSLISCSFAVKSILQDGPQCGLVALKMALDYLVSKLGGIDCSLDTITKTAIDLKYSRLGEMFNAYHMRHLAETMCNGICDVTCDVIKSEWDIIQHVALGLPLLIPYDADKNHEPTYKEGDTAHWALISGVVCATEDTTVEESMNGLCTPIEGLQNAFFIQPGNHARMAFQTFFETRPTTRWYVWANHGKSGNVALWSASQVVKSNAQLKQVSLRRPDIAEMVVPSGGDLRNVLGGRAVFLRMRTSS